MIQIVYDIEKVDFAELADVIRRAPLSARDVDELRRAFEASYAYVFVFDDGRLVGAARAISDGVYNAAVYDVVLLPEYHGRGIGTRMMRALEEKISVENIILFAVPEREGFYRKLGYRKLTTGYGKLCERLVEKGYLE